MKGSLYPTGTEKPPEIFEFDHLNTQLTSIANSLWIEMLKTGTTSRSRFFKLNKILAHISDAHAALHKLQSGNSDTP